MGRASLGVLGILLITAVTVAAAPSPPGESVAGERWVVRVGVGDSDDVELVASWLEPWEVDLDEGFFVVDVNAEELLRLHDLGLASTIDERRSAQLNRPLAKLAGQKTGIPSFPCYRTVEETLAAGAALAATYPSLATFTDIGDSWDKTQDASSGYDLMVLRITNSAVSGDKPKLWVEGAIHARELATAELVTRFAEHLLAGYDADPDITWLLDFHEIHLLLQTNPDGRKRAEAGLYWRKNTNRDTCTWPDSYGVDLNRNFGFAWGCCGGSSDEGCEGTYRGTAASSEPEVEAVQSYLRTLLHDRRPDDLVTPAPDDTMGIFLDIHAYGSVILSPWGFTPTPPPNGTQLLRLGRKLGYFNGYRAQLGSSYPVDGATKDFAYGELGVPGYTIELGAAFFEGCDAFTSIADANIEVLLYAAKAARAPYTIPAGPDVVDPVLTPVVAAPGAQVTVLASIDDTRNDAMGYEPVQPVWAAEMYVDLAPWQAGATPLELIASDGFDSPVEVVEGVLSTTGLALGRHTLYLRGQDVGANWGAPTALHFWVLDPETTPRIAGTVRSASDLGPLAATVAAGPFSTTCDPATGAYALTLAQDSHSLTGSAPGFGPQTSVGLDPGPGETVLANFLLAPNPLTDNVEGGSGDWTADSAWAITTATAASPDHSWTDSPGYYSNLADTSLMSPRFDLGDYAGVTLEFGHTFDIEAGLDFGHVEYSLNDGTSWTAAASYSGLQPKWHTAVLRLGALDGAANARIRFRLVTDEDGTRDGWYIDDIKLQGRPSAGRPRHAEERTAG